MKLGGKIALVTGGAHGIGEATARRLMAAGATVVVADVSEEGHAVAEALGPPNRFVKLDVGDEANWRAVMEEVRNAYGALHLLFLNAGVLIRPLGAPALDPAMKWLTPESYRRVSRVNGEGVVLGALYGFPLIRDSGGGLILATASTAGVDIYPGDPAYTFAKAGVIAFVRSLGAEFDAEGVRICAVCPGSVDTRIYPSDRRQQRGGAQQAAPASPDYLANAVLTIVEHGLSGEVWLARPDDNGFWVHPHDRLAPAPVEPDKVQRFVPATSDGLTLAGRPIEEALAAHRSG